MVARDWKHWEAERNSVMEELYKYGYTGDEVVTVPSILIREAERSFRESLIYISLLEAWTKETEASYQRILRLGYEQGLPMGELIPPGAGHPRDR